MHRDAPAARAALRGAGRGVAGRSCYVLLVAPHSSAPLGWVGVSNERAKLWSGGRKGVSISLFLFLIT